MTPSPRTLFSKGRKTPPSCKKTGKSATELGHQPIWECVDRRRRCTPCCKPRHAKCQQSTFARRLTARARVRLTIRPPQPIPRPPRVSRELFALTNTRTRRASRYSFSAVYLFCFSTDSSIILYTLPCRSCVACRLDDSIKSRSEGGKSRQNIFISIYFLFIFRGRRPP